MSHDGRLTTRDDRPALVFERRLDHSPERVWQAISDPKEMSRWFVAPIEVDDLVAGAKFEAMGEEGEVTELDPGTAMAWTWGGEDFRFEVRAEGAGSVLTFLHVFANRDNAAHHAVGWDLHFDRLDALLTDGEVPDMETLMDDFEQPHAQYAEEFGIPLEVSKAAMEAIMQEYKA